MYADGTIMPYSAESICARNNAVNEGKLSLNVTKTQSFLIGSQYKINTFEQPGNPKLSLAIGD